MSILTEKKHEESATGNLRLASKARQANMRAMAHMFCFGHGYSAAALSRDLIADGWSVTGTTRCADKADRMRAEGVAPLLWPDDDAAAALDQATHLLLSVAPSGDGDPVHAALADAISARAGQFDWVGYLSTTGVYGDRDGGWVDETSVLAPSMDRGQHRVFAEQQWQSVPGLPLHIFRLAGIYGPGRGPFEKLRRDNARRIIKPGQVFSRIHVEDIAQALAASIARPDPGRIYNVCDDEPAPPQDVIAHAAKLLGMPLPARVDFDEADLSPMARSFYADSKRVRNDRIKTELGVTLKYPDYRSGLAAILDAERKSPATG